MKSGNYEEKCLCVLVLDASGSMRDVIEGGDNLKVLRQEVVDGKLCDIVVGGTTKLDKLEEGLKVFYKEIEDDRTAKQRLELAIVSFNDDVKTEQAPALIQNCAFPHINARGNTALVDAVNAAIELVQDRKAWYKETNQDYCRPWIVLMTDGEPDAGQDISALASKIKSDTSAKKYVFLPIGVDGANMEVLTQLQGDIPAMKLQDAKFSEFFKWLSASMSSVTSTGIGGKVDLPSPADWMKNFAVK